MNVFEELEKITAFGNDLHCVFFGNCTAFKSPGKFATIRNQAGITQFSAEGPTIEAALIALVEKIRNNDRSSHVPAERQSAGDAKRVKLPGMK